MGELAIAQQTVKGRVYIISNIGSFGELDPTTGEAIYKIGLTVGMRNNVWTS